MIPAQFPLTQCTKCATWFMRRAWQVKDRHCSSCRNVHDRAYHLAKGEKFKEQARVTYRRRKSYYKAYWKAKRKDPTHLLKRSARSKVSNEIRSGRLQRLPCEKCLATPADAHHHDYSKPLEIVWLCRRCHFAEDRRAA